MQTRQHGRGWILTSDPKWTDNEQPGGSSSRSMSNMVEVFQCWGEKGWEDNPLFAMLFTTEKAASEYMTKNSTAM